MRPKRRDSFLQGVETETRSHPDDENPFDEGQAEAGNGSVSTGRRCGQTERQKEADPVEEECHWGQRDGPNDVKQDKCLSTCMNTERNGGGMSYGVLVKTKKKGHLKYDN